MEIKMVDFGHAIEKPFEDLKKLIIGTFLGIIPIVNLLQIGYFIKNAKQSMSKRKKKLPEWENWGDLFFNGLKAAIISFLYFLIPMIVLFGLLFVGSISGLNIASQSGSSLEAPLMLFMSAGGISVMLIFLVFSYFLPMGLMKFADTGEFGSAFQLKDIFDKVFTKKYFSTWILVAVVGTILTFIVLIPFLAIFAPILSWIVGIFSYTAFGQVYSELK